ncbi:MAG: hypothetical protein OXC07_06345 [Kistimonas sp.]|nr:hypothetical protein [Kistimonas sp.]
MVGSAGSEAIRSFVAVDLSREAAPAAPPLLKFQRLLKTYQLTERSFATINDHLEARGAMLVIRIWFGLTKVRYPGLTEDRAQLFAPQVPVASCTGMLREKGPQYSLARSHTGLRESRLREFPPLWGRARTAFLGLHTQADLFSTSLRAS